MAVADLRENFPFPAVKSVDRHPVHIPADQMVGKYIISFADHNLVRLGRIPVTNTGWPIARFKPFL